MRRSSLRYERHSAAHFLHSQVFKASHSVRSFVILCIHNTNVLAQVALFTTRTDPSPTSHSDMLLQLVLYARILREKFDLGGHARRE